MKIIIGVPAYNEAWNIRRLLHNLLHVQNLNEHHLETVIVVCSGCTDGTDQIVKEMTEENEKITGIFDTLRKGKSYALNQIFDKAKEFSPDVVIICNADVMPHQDSFRKLLAPFSSLESPNIGCTLAHSVPINDKDRIINKTVHAWWNLIYEINEEGAHRLAGELFAMKFEAFEPIPVNIINDDLYIEYILVAKGYELVYVPDAVVWIKGPERWGDFIMQRKRINLGHFQMKKLYKVMHLSIRDATKYWLRYFVRNPDLGLLCLSFVEIASRLSAYKEYLTGSFDTVWTPIGTTKRWKMPAGVLHRRREPFED